jgi:hypothetical protein
LSKDIFVLKGGGAGRAEFIFFGHETSPCKIVTAWSYNAVDYNMPWPRDLVDWSAGGWGVKSDYSSIQVEFQAVPNGEVIRVRFHSSFGCSCVDRNRNGGPG